MHTRAAYGLDMAQLGCIHLGVGWLDLESGSVHRNSRIFGLTALECQVLAHLFERSPAAVGTDELLRDVWAYAPGVRTETVKTTIRRIRTKLGAGRRRLVTVRGVGYRLVVDPAGGAPPSGHVVLVAVRGVHRWAGRGRTALEVALERLQSPGGFAIMSSAARSCLAFPDANTALAWVAELRGFAPAELAFGVARGVGEPPSYQGEDLDRATALADGASLGELVADDDLLHPEQDPTRRVPQPGNLGASRDSLVGRGEVLAQVLGALQERRLVTLVGTGGCGKTRLALEAARRAQRRGGAWFVDLVPARARADVLDAIAGALGLGARVDLIDALADWLTVRGDALVVLDNCEQVRAPVAELASRLLDLVPGLTVLATSREALGLAGERRIEVAPLGLPPTEARSAVAESPAVELLLARASDLDLHLEVTDVTAPQLAAIVRAVDGLPLGVELVAPRLRALTLAEAAAMLRWPLDAFALGSVGAEGGDDRHRTLREVTQWSWDLLTPRLQVALARLSVFHGGFSLDAAEAVLGGGAAHEVLIELENHGLVRARQSEDSMRFDLWVTVRSFAAERLGAMGAQAEVERCHLAYCARPLARATAVAWADLDALTLAVLASRGRPSWALAEVLAAGTRALERGDEAAAGCCAVVAVPQVAERGPFEEAVALLDALPARMHGALGVLLDWCRGWLLGEVGRTEDALALLARARRACPDGAGVLRAQIALQTGHELLRAGQVSQGIRALEEALELGADPGWAEGRLSAVGLLAQAAMFAGELDRAAELAEVLRREAAAIRSPSGRARAQSHLAMVRFLRCEPELGLPAAREAVALTEALGDVTRTQSYRMVLCSLQCMAGDLEDALVAQEACLMWARSAGGPGHVLEALYGLGTVHLDLGRLALARELLEEALARARELGRPREAARTLARLADAAFLSGDLELAARRAGTASGEHRAQGDAAGASRATTLLARVALALSDLERAAELATRSAAAAALPAVALEARIVGIQVLLARGDVAGARAELDDVGPAVVWAVQRGLVRCLEAEWALLRGDRDRARRYAAAAAELAGRMGVGPPSYLGSALTSVQERLSARARGRGDRGGDL